MKLYWRYKKDGKWTWKPAVDVGCDDAGFICVIPYEEESGKCPDCALIPEDISFTCHCMGGSY